MIRELSFRPLDYRLFAVSLRVMCAAILLGWLISPDPHEASPKAIIMLVGLVFSWLLSRAPNRWVPSIPGWFSMLALGIALYFLISLDWSAHQADFTLLTRLGDGLDRLLPALPLPGMQPNKAGGLLVMFFPFTYLFFRQRIHQATILSRSASFAALAFIVFAIVMSSSRAAWFSLILGSISAWLIMRLQAKWRVRALIFALALSVLFVSFAIASTIYGSDTLTGLLNRLPGERTGESRLELASSGLHLIADFPLTGSGLQSFAAVYSQYILVIPYFKFSYSHNLYLDLYLELGILGLFSWLLVYSAAAHALIRAPRLPSRDNFTDYPSTAALASLITVSLHGLVDDSLINGAFSPFFFLIPGFAFLIQRERYSPRPRREAEPLTKTRKLRTWLLPICASLVLIILAWSTFLSTGYANLGALQMVKVELADFPTGEWQPSSLTPALSAAKENFLQALRLNPQNQTANHRLGLIAMLERDYPTALHYLQSAHRSSPTHRGILKNLGYTYLWLGNFPAAQQIFSTLPETAEELRSYQTWWITQGNPDFSDTAARFIEYSK